MNRVLVVVSSAFVAVLSSCGGMGRCTADSQCPVGSSCDSTIGVCVTPGGGSSSGGGSGSTDGGSGGNPSMISADYGKSCTGSNSCSSLPGTSCVEGPDQCLSSCAGGAKCPVGSECFAYDMNICVRTCASNADCSSEQYCSVSTYSASKVCYTKKDKWSLGRECGSDNDCESSAFCVKKNGQTKGVCTKVCDSKSECGLGQECIVTGSSGASACFDVCFAVGQQSHCINGFSCRALSGVDYGWCG